MSFEAWGLIRVPIHLCFFIVAQSKSSYVVAGVLSLAGIVLH